MDLRLINYVKSLAELTQIEAETPQKTEIVRVTNSVLGRTTVIVVAVVEPHELQLPLNVLWAVFDKTSMMYKKMYKRVSKDADPIMNTQHSWEELTSFSSMWEAQYYAPGDEPSGGDIPEATVNMRGTVQISVDGLDPALPIAVTSTDPRNTDSRYPLEHNEMHAEKPLNQVATTKAPVTIGNSVDGESFTIQANVGQVTATNRLLKRTEIMQDSTTFTVAQDPANLVKAPYRAELVIPELTLNERLSGIPASAAKTFTFALRAFANEDQEQDITLRKFLGYFRPTTVRVNGVVQANNTLQLTQAGTYQIEVELTNNPSTATVTVSGTLVCIP